MERRVQGPVIDSEHSVAGALDMLRDGMAMRWSEHERSEYQHVQRALQ